MRLLSRSVRHNSYFTMFAVCGIVIAATARAADVPPSAPRSPSDEQATFRFADSQLTVDLVAAEPDVISPVAMCWDAAGAMYVAEMRDYPVGPASGTIRRLEDRDGDGRYETATIFADKLKFPNGVLAVRDGLLVTAAPDLLFLRDTDGDGIADERRVLFTGFAEGNQQLRANGLVWGLDNWVYGANGRSDGEIRRPDQPAGEAISIRTRDFRFRADGSAFEPVIGQSQFGQTRDDWGHRFLSWNTIVIREQMFAAADLERNPQLASYAVHNLAEPDDSGEVFPIAARPQTFNRESTNHYNAMCGLTVYRGPALGEKYYGNAFVGESLSGLVHRRELVPRGPTFVSRRAETGQEFLAAADTWFHPVYLTTGPDGALYLADFYRRWVEHPQFVAGEWRDRVDWREGVGHGRIWRIRRRDFKTEPTKKLAKASSAALVAALADPGAWTRDAAQRLLYERQDRSCTSQLVALARGSDPRAAAIALHTLSDLGTLDENVLTAALSAPAAMVREQAVELAARRLAQSAALRAATLKLAKDADVSVRFQVARSLGDIAGDEKLAALLMLAESDDADGWIARAISASVGSVAGRWLRALAANNSKWFVSPSRAQLEALEQINERFVAAGGAQAAESVSSIISTTTGNPSTVGQLAVLSGAARAARGQSANVLSPENQSRTLERAVALALDAAAAADYRVLAVRVLADSGAQQQLTQLLPLCAATETGPVADASVAAVCRRGDDDAIRRLIDGWNAYTPSRRRLLSSATLESPSASRLLVEALEHDVVRPAEIDPAVRTALGKVRDTDVAARAERVFAAATPAPRDEVLGKYRPALELSGDRARGAALFKAHCNNCHQLFGLGRQVGPDLSGVGGKPKETLLTDLLDPSRQVAPDFLAYTLVTTDGRSLAGLLVSDTAAAVTMRRGEGADDTISKSDIEELQASQKSLMPEGFEQRLSVQDVADLLAFLALPERRLVEAAPVP